MKTNLLGYVLVSLLTIQVRGSILQPTDLRENASILWDQLNTYAQTEVNKAYIEIISLTQNVSEPLLEAINKKVPEIQTAIDEIFVQLHNLRNDALDNGLNYKICQNTSDLDLNQYLQGYILRADSCIIRQHHYGFNAISDNLGDATLNLQDVERFRRVLKNCLNDNCVASVSEEIQDLLDHLGNYVRGAKLLAEGAVSYSVDQIAKCTVDGNLGVTHYGQLFISMVKECLRQL